MSRRKKKVQNIWALRNWRRARRARRKARALLRPVPPPAVVTPGHEKMPVSARALMQRIQRKLEPEHKQIVANVGRNRELVGHYVICDLKTGWVCKENVDLEVLARKLKVIHAWEEYRPSAGRTGLVRARQLMAKARGAVDAVAGPESAGLVRAKQLVAQVRNAVDAAERIRAKQEAEHSRTVRCRVCWKLCEPADGGLFCSVACRTEHYSEKQRRKEEANARMRAKQQEFWTNVRALRELGLKI